MKNQSNKSNNPEGHNQYTKKDQSSNKKSGSQSMKADGRSSSSQQGQVNNPEGHNQYTKKNA